MQRTLIPESQRIAHTAQLFGVHFPLRLEPTVYAIAGNLSADYTGGYWHFYALENHAFYLASPAPLRLNPSRSSGNPGCD